MAFKKVREESCLYPGEYVCEFICDSEDDVVTLPECAAGSMATVAVEGMPIYMKNASNAWVRVV